MDKVCSVENERESLIQWDIFSQYALAGGLA